MLRLCKLVSAMLVKLPTRILQRLIHNKVFLDLAAPA